MPCRRALLPRHAFAAHAAVVCRCLRWFFAILLDVCRFAATACCCRHAMPCHYAGAYTPRYSGICHDIASSAKIAATRAQKTYVAICARRQGLIAHFMPRRRVSAITRCLMTFVVLPRYVAVEARYGMPCLCSACSLPRRRLQRQSASTRCHAVCRLLSARSHGTR